MKTLDEFATMAVAEVRAEAAQIADTEAALADVRSEVQLVAAAPTSRPVARGHRRRFLMIGAAAAACVAVVVAAAAIGGNDQTVRPAQSTPTTEPAPSTIDEPVPSMSSPIYDEATGSEIVFQFTRQWEECDPRAYCAYPGPFFLAPMVTSEGRIIIGEDSVLGSPSWLVAADGDTTRVPIDSSWTVRDAAMAPDDTVYAMVTIGEEAFLYRYDDADMSSPELVAGPESWTIDDGSVALFIGGTGGSEQIEYDGGLFIVRRPMDRPLGGQLAGDGPDTFVQVDFLDGTSHQFDVKPGGGGELAAPSLHPLANSVALIHVIENMQLSIIVMLPDGTMRERLVPELPLVVANEQRFVDEGYYYLLTAETTSACCTSTTAVYSVRRFALPAADEPPIVVPSTLAPASTPEPTATQVLVSGTAIAGLEFGLTIGEVLPQLIATLGEPNGDESVEYTRNADGAWTSRYGSFEHRFMRQVCWGAVTITCAVFGGDSADQLRLVGWWASAGANLPSPVYSAAGMRLGSVPADLGIEVTPAQGDACVGFGHADAANGIHLRTTVLGTTVGSAPDPADIVIIEMSAGARPDSAGSDC